MLMFICLVDRDWREFNCRLKLFLYPEFSQISNYLDSSHDKWFHQRTGKNLDFTCWFSRQEGLPHLKASFYTIFLFSHPPFGIITCFIKNIVCQPLRKRIKFLCQLICKVGWGKVSYRYLILTCSHVFFFHTCTFYGKTKL